MSRGEAGEGLERTLGRCLRNWNEDKNAVGYNIRYGSNQGKLYHNYQVLKSDSLTIRSLNAKQKYYFTIDSFNENGIKQGTQVVSTD